MNMSIISVSHASNVPATSSPQVKEFANALLSNTSSATSLVTLLDVIPNKIIATNLGKLLVSERVTTASLVSLDLQFDVVENHTPYARTICSIGKDCVKPMVLVTKPFPDRTRIEGFVPTSISTLLSSILCYQKAPAFKKMLEDFNSLDIFKYLQDKFKENPINAILHLSRIICLCNVVDTITETFHIYFDNYDVFKAFKSKLSQTRKELDDNFMSFVKPLSLFHDVFEFEKCLTSVNKIKAIE